MTSKKKSKLRKVSYILIALGGVMFYCFSMVLPNYWIAVGSWLVFLGGICVYFYDAVHQMRKRKDQREQTN